MPNLWDTYARYYDAITGLAPYQDMLDDVLAALELKPGMRVLDAGCGTGVLAERIAAAHPEVELVAVDLSPAMLRRARSRRAWPAKCAFIECGIDEFLNGDARGFDRIASVNVIWTLPDPQGTLTRMTDRLGENGRMVHTTPSWRLRPIVIAWNHLCRQKGWGLLRAILGLPRLVFAGLLNLVLVAQTLSRSHAPRANRKWDRPGLVEFMRAANAPAREVRPCYAGQGFLLVCEKADASRLKVPGDHL
jgi:SAM-dependent methyltransferase